MPGLGVCSWSLRPSGPDALADAVREVGVDAVQLALGPLRAGEWDEKRTMRALDKAGVRVASGMMATRGEDYSTLDSIRRTGGLRPDQHWPANLALAQHTADLARRLSIPLVTFHAGFIPESPGPERTVMLERVRAVAVIFEQRGVELALETGQETAQTLTLAIAELAPARVGVNFDPANMILYGMGDPVDALARLLPHVRQVHVKDAVPATTPGEWGTEVVAGTGAVNWSAFFRDLSLGGGRIDLMIEREAGDDRVADARAAAALVRTHLAASSGRAT